MKKKKKRKKKITYPGKCLPKWWYLLLITTSGMAHTYRWWCAPSSNITRLLRVILHNSLLCSSIALACSSTWYLPIAMIGHSRQLPSLLPFSAIPVTCVESFSSFPLSAGLFFLSHHLHIRIYFNYGKPLPWLVGKKKIFLYYNNILGMLRPGIWGIVIFVPPLALCGEMHRLRTPAHTYQRHMQCRPG